VFGTSLRLNFSSKGEAFTADLERSAAQAGKADRMLFLAGTPFSGRMAIVLLLYIHGGERRGN
jgi:hypothetical protein